MRTRHYEAGFGKLNGILFNKSHFCIDEDGYVLDIYGDRTSLQFTNKELDQWVKDGTLKFLFEREYNPLFFAEKRTFMSNEVNIEPRYPKNDFRTSSGISGMDLD